MANETGTHQWSLIDYDGLNFNTGAGVVCTSIENYEQAKKLLDAINQAIRDAEDGAYDRSEKLVTDLLFALKEIRGNPNQIDLIKLAKRIRKLKHPAKKELG